ncbi:MAG: Holliday junction branch migration protein RuvA [Bacteroidales bacterium]|jgi:Holliday junction DNA helicase RuvA
MFEYIYGKLIYANPAFAIVECNGIGYNIQISVNTYTFIKDLKEVKLFLHHIVREDAEFLYGFYDQKERLLFRHLITVSGIGAATARLMFSSLSVSELYTAIVNGDVNTLKTVKGIGIKTAQRVIVDLKDKLLKEDFDISENATVYNNLVNETLAALMALGFPKQTCERAIKKIIDKKTDTDILSVEDLIKETLKIL